ncbi:MAG: alpha-L-fucosidase [Promethearchaeota archaeon]
MTGEDLPDSSLPTPDDVQYEWHEQERIMFVCLDPCTWQEREYDNHSFPLSGMKLPNLDTDQWCEAALAWGAREILFVAKHTGGFCWWQTDTTDYSVKNIAWKDGKGDLLVELAKSCKKHGINMGIYVYPGDESWGAGIGSGGKTRDPEKQEEYNGVFRQQLREVINLAAEHVRVIEIWFDGSCIIEVGDILKECAPNAVVLQGPHATIRWVGNEKGILAPDKAWSTLSTTDLKTGLSTQQQSNPDGNAWAPLEVDVTLYDHNWFWAKKNEKKRKSLTELLRIFYQSVGQGAVMLLNSTPNTDGLIPDDDLRLYKMLGEEISRRFDKPSGKTAGYTKRLEIDFSNPTEVNHVVISEDIRLGERVRRFNVEGWDDAKGTWKKIATGTHVGRKTIIPLKTTSVQKIRLDILDARGTPQILDFSTYNVLGYKLDRKKKEPITWTNCGSWSLPRSHKQRSTLRIDLTPFITRVGLWEIEFQLQSGRKITITEEKMYQAGQISIPGILTRPSKRKNRLQFNRTAVITEDARIELEVTLKGKKSAGIVLIRPIL